MAFELAGVWLTPYLDAADMNPSHPLRGAAFDAADAQVMESYRGLDTSDWDDGPFSAEVLNEATGQDVATLLRGIAEMLIHAGYKPEANG